jgi:hypothetical protein
LPKVLADYRWYDDGVGVILGRVVCGRLEVEWFCQSAAQSIVKGQSSDFLESKAKESVGSVGVNRTAEGGFNGMDIDKMFEVI